MSKSTGKKHDKPSIFVLDPERAFEGVYCFEGNKIWAEINRLLAQSIQVVREKVLKALEQLKEEAGKPEVTKDLEAKGIQAEIYHRVGELLRGLSDSFIVGPHLFTPDELRHFHMAFQAGLMELDPPIDPAAKLDDQTRALWDKLPRSPKLKERLRGFVSEEYLKEK